MVNGTDETAFIQAIIGTHGAFGRIDKKPGSSGQEEIAMRRPFLKNSTLQGSDVRMGIENVPREVGKILNIGVGDGTFVRQDGHARLDILEVVFEGMLRRFDHLCARLVNARYSRQSRRSALNGAALHIMFDTPHATHFLAAACPTGTTVDQCWERRAVAGTSFGRFPVQHQNTTVVTGRPDNKFSRCRVTTVVFWC